MYRQAVQSVFRDGEAKLLKVPRGIGEAPLIRHVQRPMNIGALVQEVYDARSAALTAMLSDRTALAETADMADVSSFAIL